MRAVFMLHAVCAAVLLVLPLAMGCGPTLLEQTWGSSYRENTEKMIANPEAAEAESEPVENLDPVTGELVVERYKSKKGEPEFAPREIFVIPEEN
jgi:hypothetical protein